MIKTRSPAKLILSGEHAVVYGKPGLAMAIDYYTEVVVGPYKPQIIKFKCPELGYECEYSIDEMRKYKERLAARYKRFIQLEIAIKDVLSEPTELLLYTVATLIDTVPQGLNIEVSSKIPIGCGMGSSAAMIMSVMKAVNCFLELNMSDSELLSLGRQIENLQHGKSSGLDLQVIMSGGCLKFRTSSQQYLPNASMKGCPDEIEQLTVAPLPWFSTVNTGTPESTTGEVVTTVAPHFTPEKLAEYFQAVTDAFADALCKQNLLDLQYATKENHKLLMHLGVVPERVADFIASIEQWGGAVKVCGAGSVKGEQAGVVLIVSEQPHIKLADRFEYQLKEVKMDAYGTEVI